MHHSRDLFQDRNLEIRIRFIYMAVPILGALGLAVRIVRTGSHLHEKIDMNSSNQ